MHWRPIQEERRYHVLAPKAPESSFSSVNALLHGIVFISVRTELDVKQVQHQRRILFRTKPDSYRLSVFLSCCCFRFCWEVGRGRGLFFLSFFLMSNLYFARTQKFRYAEIRILLEIDLLSRNIQTDILDQ